MARDTCTQQGYNLRDFLLLDYYVFCGCYILVTIHLLVKVNLVLSYRYLWKYYLQAEIIYFGQN